jgi:hypothetical protein
LAFRLRPTIEWTREKWAALEGLAQEFGLTIDVENAIHLQQGPEKKEIASIHEISVENDICIVPDYARGDELLEAIGSRIFGAHTDRET